MTAPIANLSRPLLHKPANAIEWALAVPVWLTALGIPVALLVFTWPVIMAAGMFGVAVFCVVLALGFVILTCVLWLFAPFLTLTLMLAAGLVDAVRGLYRLTAR